MQISVLGSGAWGTALSVMLISMGHRVSLWTRSETERQAMHTSHENAARLPGVILPDTLHITNDLPFACTGVPVIVCAVPSVSMSDVLGRIADLVTPGTVLVSASKGFIQSGDRYIRISEAMQSMVAQGVPAVLTGPSHAEEVARGMPTACVAASPDRAAAELAQEAFMNEAFRVYTSPDMVGAELGGALKNVIALAAGICDGMSLGDNTRAALMTRGLTEMARLGVAMGGCSETFAGLSGLGDLIVTCTSRHSRNHRAGVLIGAGHAPEEAVRLVGAAVEGYWAARGAYAQAVRFGIEMPITQEIYRILYEGRNPVEAIGELMQRGPKHEISGW